MRSVSSALGNRLGHVTCFGQWDVGRVTVCHDASPEAWEVTVPWGLLGLSAQGAVSLALCGHARNGLLGDEQPTLRCPCHPASATQLAGLGVGPPTACQPLAERTHTVSREARGGVGRGGVGRGQPTLQPQS